MFLSKVIIVISAIFAYCESASIVDNIKKCGLGEDECQRDMYRSIIQEVADSGIPEMGIPVIDPFEIKNMETTILALLKLGITEGTMKGFKTCRSNKYHTDDEKLITTVELECEAVNLEGHYNIRTTPTLEALIGSIKIHGEGKTGVTIEKPKLNLDIPFEIIKLDDSELHMRIIPDRISFTFEILGKMTIAADNLYVGSQEISAVVVNIINENWEFVSKSIGKSVIDKGIEVFTENANKFFAAVPITDLISGDLSSHVTS